MEVQLLMQMRSGDQISTSNYGKVFLNKLTAIKNALNWPLPHIQAAYRVTTIVFSLWYFYWGNRVNQSVHSLNQKEESFLNFLFSGYSRNNNKLYPSFFFVLIPMQGESKPELRVETFIIIDCFSRQKGDEIRPNVGWTPLLLHILRNIQHSLFP